MMYGEIGEMGCDSRVVTPACPVTWRSVTASSSPTPTPQ